MQPSVSHIALSPHSYLITSKHCQLLKKWGFNSTEDNSEREQDQSKIHRNQKTQMDSSS